MQKNIKKIVSMLGQEREAMTTFDKELYKEYGVKRGLRKENGAGVLVGLTKIGDVRGYRQAGETLTPCEGSLHYRGYDLHDLVARAQKKQRCGYEEVVFLLLGGRLPEEDELTSFTEHLNQRMPLVPREKMSLIGNWGLNVMNLLSRTVLMMYTRDPYSEDFSYENVMRQCLDLTARFPTAVAYAYQAKHHSVSNEPLSIRTPLKGVPHAENFLYMLKGKGNYTDLEVQLLDLMLMIHAEHGGGNNSTFTTRVVTSSGSDTYSIIASALASLKGPLHGGAALSSGSMMVYLKETVSNWEDENELERVLRSLLKKEGYDRSGKIYGLGHAVYTVSDPRATLLKEQAGKLAIEKDRVKELLFHNLVEKIGIKILTERNNKPIATNVDFYSGFVYSCLGIPQELYTPLFAISRIAGWCAHRMEEGYFNQQRILRPAYRIVVDEKSI